MVDIQNMSIVTFMTGLLIHYLLSTCVLLRHVNVDLFIGSYNK